MSGIHHLHYKNPVNQLKESQKIFHMLPKITIIETSLINLLRIRKMEIQRKILFILDIRMEMDQIQI